MGAFQDGRGVRRHRKLGRQELPIRNFYWTDAASTQRRVAIRLEDQFWEALGEIAAAKGMTRSALISELVVEDRDHNFTSMVRVFVLQHFRRKGIER